jgi:hypothetical protein
VRAVTGVHFHIFQDIGGIGEHWPGKLDQMLEESSVLHPDPTPSYFTSRPCRQELEKFLRAEAERGRNDLVGANRRARRVLWLIAGASALF